MGLQLHTAKNVIVGARFIAPVCPGPNVSRPCVQARCIAPTCVVQGDGMIGKVTYHQQVSYCGKPRCKKCREGTGHGPYWYAYQTVDGRTSRTYVGKTLPQEALETIEGLQPPLPVHR